MYLYTGVLRTSYPIILDASRKHEIVVLNIIDVILRRELKIS